jgi:hypothetical protein
MMLDRHLNRDLDCDVKGCRMNPARRLAGHVVAMVLALAAPSAVFVAGSLAFSQPAHAADVTIENLSYDMGLLKISIPKLDVRGTPLSASALRALLDPATGGDVVSRLVQLQATSASMPSVVLTQDIAGTKQATTFHDVVLADIRAGVIGLMKAAGASGEMNDQVAGKMTFTAAAISAEAVDLPLAARVLTTSVPNPEQVPMGLLYRSFGYSDYVVELPMGTGKVSIARIFGREAKARPGREPLLTTMRSVMDMAEKHNAAGAGKRDEPRKAELAMIGQMFRVFENFEYGVMDAEGLKATFKADKNDGLFEIGRMRLSDQAANPGFAISQMRAEAGPAKMSLAEFEMRDFSFRNTIRAAIEMLDKSDVTALMTDYKRLIPKLGTIRLQGLAVEGPETGSPRRTGPPQTFRAALKSFELGVASQLDGIPTALKFGAEELAAPLPTNSREQGVRDLIAMGYKDINLSWLADLAWQKDSRQIDVKALNVSAKDMLSASITAQIGNISAEAFSTDMALAQVAWLSASAQRLTLNVQNFGGFEKILAREAGKANKTPDALRREWGTLAALALPAILGDSDGAKALTAAVSRFVARPGTLDVDLKARLPGGVGLADAVAVMGAPQALFDKIEVTASAK